MGLIEIQFTSGGMADAGTADADALQAAVNRRREAIKAMFEASREV